MAINRKERQAKRARALTPHRGRKPGPTPLHKQPRRFEIAVFRAIRIWAPTMPEVIAAEIGVNFNDSTEIAWIEKIIKGEQFEGLAFNYTGGWGELMQPSRIVNNREIRKFDSKKKSHDRSVAL